MRLYGHVTTLLRNVHTDGAHHHDALIGWVLRKSSSLPARLRVGGSLIVA
jgi:hypothetical protein